MAFTLIAGTTIRVDAKQTPREQHHEQHDDREDQDDRDGNCHSIPDSGSTLPLLGAGFIGLFFVRRKFQVVG